jgi:hypothetical protein
VAAISTNLVYYMRHNIALVPVAPSLDSRESRAKHKGRQMAATTTKEENPEHGYI